tara:strand:+ start:348 stop:677 length:330 start_codon:yes stop_codon:yes gene_type:complete
MNIKRMALEYFKAFESKRLNLLEIMFAESITLRDWELNLHGKKEVLLAIENIFNTSKSLSIKPIVIYSNKNTIIAELEIVINNKDKIAVVDIIKFNDLGKISAIRAYRG